MVSLHYGADRNSRERFICEHLGGNGKIVDSFIVDKGHKNGAELHCVTDNGIIIVYNVNSRKMVTKLIARPQQIERYYMHTKKNPPRELLELCREHQRMGYNYL